MNIKWMGKGDEYKNWEEGYELSKRRITKIGITEKSVKRKEEKRGKRVWEAEEGREENRERRVTVD